MQKALILVLGIVLVMPLSGCWKCSECTASTEYGEVTREVCGRKSNTQALIRELESDTVGVGPWICK